MKFKVIDNNTGKEADAYEIALKEKWAKNLCYCDIDGFAILEDGTLILVDECGNFEYCDPKRFKVIFENNQPRAEWNAHYYVFFDVPGIECSKCKKDVPYWTNHYDVPDFCPNCGEPMTDKALEILRKKYANDIVIGGAEE